MSEIAMRWKKWVGAGLLVALVVAAAIVPADLLARTATSESDRAAAPVTVVDAKTQALLGIFDRARTAADALPRPEGPDPIAPDSLAGEAYDLSRRADQPGTGGPVFVWPEDDGACFSTAGVSSCADAAAIKQRGVVWALYRGNAITEGMTRVAGIAKDGVDAVTVVLDDGAQVVAPVSENAFRVDVRGAPVELRWSEPGGGQSAVRLPSLTAAPPSAG
jgi:hypothetical protein